MAAYEALHYDKDQLKDACESINKELKAHESVKPLVFPSSHCLRIKYAQILKVSFGQILTDLTGERQFFSLCKD